MVSITWRRPRCHFPSSSAVEADTMSEAVGVVTSSHVDRPMHSASSIGAALTVMSEFQVSVTTPLGLVLSPLRL